MSPNTGATKPLVTPSMRPSAPPAAAAAVASAWPVMCYTHACVPVGCSAQGDLAVLLHVQARIMFPSTAMTAASGLTVSAGDPVERAQCFEGYVEPTSSCNFLYLLKAY
jgi:hypothetical protein